MKHQNKIIPHEFPMFLIDRILEKIPGKHVHGIKNITYNDWFVNKNDTHAHMPEVLIIEAIGQIGAYTSDEKEEKMGLVTGFSGVTISGKAYVGDCVDLYFEVIKKTNKVLKGRGSAFVQGKKIVDINTFTVIYLT